ncbi:WD40-repeat-containing domain protein [Zopfochytrium polystomum]|nr:WD40-repeat-containing domain protein [Zopfochytrium polystomum]
MSSNTAATAASTVTASSTATTATTWTARQPPHRRPGAIAAPKLAAAAGKPTGPTAAKPTAITAAKPAAVTAHRAAAGGPPPTKQLPPQHHPRPQPPTPPEDPCSSSSSMSTTATISSTAAPTLPAPVPPATPKRALSQLSANTRPPTASPLQQQHAHPGRRGTAVSVTPFAVALAAVAARASSSSSPSPSKSSPLSSSSSSSAPSSASASPAAARLLRVATAAAAAAAAATAGGGGVGAEAAGGAGLAARRRRPAVAGAGDDGGDLAVADAKVAAAGSGGVRVRVGRGGWGRGGGGVRVDGPGGLVESDAQDGPPSGRGDRATRTTSADLPSTQYHLSKDDSSGDAEGKTAAAAAPLDAEALAHQEALARACGVSLNRRILAFKAEAPLSVRGEALRTHWRPPTVRALPATHRRHISSQPDRILDAPGLANDYYLNLLDWSATNQVAVGLADTVYVWNATSGSVTEVCQLPGPGDIVGGGGGVDPAGAVCSVQWNDEGRYLSVGTWDGKILVVDVVKGSLMRTMQGHASRVGALTWSGHTVSSGARDGSIKHHDVRDPRHQTAVLVGHSAEVCGLKWRADGAMLASGGNDNLVNVWDARSSAPRHTKSNHNAAVKAIGWCPWQLSLLATGGGQHDRHIHFWNTQTGAKLSSVDTGSQVTAILWSHRNREFLSTHGFPQNQLSVWNYPSLTKVIDIPGHDSRILHAALSPDGETVASVASDENMKFWKVFAKKKGAAGAGNEGAGGAAAGAAGRGGNEDEDDLVKATRALTLR